MQLKLFTKRHPFIYAPVSKLIAVGGRIFASTVCTIGSDDGLRRLFGAKPFSEPMLTYQICSMTFICKQVDNTCS